MCIKPLESRFGVFFSQGRRSDELNSKAGKLIRLLAFLFEIIGYTRDENKH